MVKITKKRIAEIKRETKETQIKAELNIDGMGDSEIITEVGFLKHMLDSFAKHGMFDLKLRIKGDLEVDQHHTLEDTGIVLGLAFKKALGDKKGISRAGYFVYPMDDSLATVAVDISGRPFLSFKAEFKRRFCGDLDTDLIEDFFIGFANSLKANIHVKADGRSDHHKIEAVFKAFGRAMSMACSRISSEEAVLLTTKGEL